MEKDSKLQGFEKYTNQLQKLVYTPFKYEELLLALVNIRKQK